MKLLTFSTFGRSLLFFVVLALTLVIAINFYFEQAESLEVVSMGQFRKIVKDLLDETTSGAGLTGDLGEINIDRLREELTRLQDPEIRLKEISTVLVEKVDQIKIMGGSALVVGKYRAHLKKANEIRVVTFFGSYLSGAMYALIYFLALFTFVYILFISPGRRSKRVDELFKGFDSVMSGSTLIPSIDPLSFYRTRAIELNESSITKENGFINYLANLGLLGTLFGLALAFYTAASSFPTDLSSVFGSNESQLIVVSGLIQTIFNYSFAVITSLVAYSLALCLRILRGATKISILKDFDKKAYDKMILLDYSRGATERAIVTYIKEIVSKVDLEGRLKSILDDLMIFVEATKTTIEAEVIRLKESVGKTAEMSVYVNNKVKGLDGVLDQLKESGELLRDKLDRITQEMAK